LRNDLDRGQSVDERSAAVLSAAGCRLPARHHQGQRTGHHRSSRVCRQPTR
jgi:hypothetical protein